MCVCVCVLSCVQLFATAWTIAHQVLLCMGFSRQEYWSGLPFPPPGDLPNPGIEPAFSALADGFFTTVPPGKPIRDLRNHHMQRTHTHTHTPDNFRCVTQVRTLRGKMASPNFANVRD